MTLKNSRSDRAAVVRFVHNLKACNEVSGSRQTVQSSEFNLLRISDFGLIPARYAT
jgi:hypothetical protein